MANAKMGLAPRVLGLEKRSTDALRKGTGSTRPATGGFAGETAQGWSRRFRLDARHEQWTTNRICPLPDALNGAGSAVANAL